MFIFGIQSLPTNTIQTTFVEQAPEKNWDQPWQDACEEAAFLNAHYFYQNKTPDKAKIVADLKSMFVYQDKQGWSHDIPIHKLAKQAREQFGYKTKVIRNPKLGTIKKLVDEKKPVIAMANGKTLYIENKNFKGGGPYYHALTILGYDDAKEQFVVHDVGTRKGAYFRYSYKLLMSAIKDLPPSGKKQEIQSGTPRILVLL